MKKLIYTLKHYCWLILYMSLITYLLYARDILDYPINKYLFVMICVGISFVVKYHHLSSVIMFTLPLMCGLPGNFFLPIWCVLILRHQIKFRTIHRPAIIFILVFSIWEFVIYLFYPFDIKISSYMGYISSIMLLCLLVSERSKGNYSNSVISFLIGCCVLLVCIYQIIAVR